MKRLENHRTFGRGWLVSMLRDGVACPLATTWSCFLSFAVSCVTYFGIIHEILVERVAVVWHMVHRIVLRVVSSGFGFGSRTPLSSHIVRFQSNTKPMVIYTVLCLSFRSFDLIPVATIDSNLRKGLRFTRGQIRATASRPAKVRRLRKASGQAIPVDAGYR
ncbi:hypothetical protein LZ32DRAFT_268438 [Colletotrichum eremochloae]|nr:hypothetical protein LZ32DRAFT_268438 [Colletotrichum eremochloae]